MASFSVVVKLQFSSHENFLMILKRFGLNDTTYFVVLITDNHLYMVSLSLNALSRSHFKSCDCCTNQSEHQKFFKYHKVL